VHFYIFDLAFYILH